MKVKVSAYQARTKLPALPLQVQAGTCFTITNRGKPIAELRPPSTHERPDARAAIAALQAFRKANPVHRKVNIRKLIGEGRE